jgi:iron complex outermembrane receptor protein
LKRFIWAVSPLVLGVCLAAPACAEAPAPQDQAAAATDHGAGAQVVAQQVRQPSTASQSSSDSTTSLGEIVVTAQRRAETMQKVPIAVNAVTAKDLQARGLDSTMSLTATVPNLDITQNGTTLTLYLRGVGSNASDPNDEASVAMYVDGVYIASPLANLFDFNNIERVEVLKGPQGTLFGRNATGGVIQVITSDPSSTPGGQASVTYGNYNTVGATFYGTTGLAPNLSADLAGVYRQNFDGYGYDINLHDPIMRREDLDLRSKLLWEPTSSTQVRLTLDYERVRSDGTPYQLVPGVIGADGVTTYPGPYRTDTNEKNVGDSDTVGAALRVDQDLGFARFVSISSYRHTLGLYDLDEDATPAPVVNSYIHQLAKDFSQEFQLLSPQGSKLQWVLGAYLFDATYGYEPITIAGLAAGAAGAENIYGTQETHSYSVYGQATYEILRKLNLTVGVRFTDENQEDHSYIMVGQNVVLAPPNQGQSFEKPTWRFALSYQFTDSIMGYISENRGIKSGGYNLIGPGAPGYKPEILDAYEVGLKTEFFGDRLRLNGASFYYNYQDIQVQNIEAGAINTVNAASAEIYGVDGDFAAVPIRNLTVTGAVGYTYGFYVKFPNATCTPSSPLDGPQYSCDATGNRVINTPRWTTSGSIDYRIPTQYGSFLYDLTGSYRSMAFVSADNRLSIPAYAVFNTTLTWTPEASKYSVQLWVHNLLDKQYYASRVETSVGDLQYLAPPRTFGMTLGMKF